MAENKTLEREYVIPLKREWLKVPRYERTSKAIKTIKKFIAKHMKVPERDVSKVKLDVYFNNDVWFRGKKKAPSKVKVKAVKKGDIVYVTFVDIPDHVKFLKTKHEKMFKPSEKKSKPSPIEGEKDEKSEEQKKDEKEKEKSVAVLREKQAEQQATVQKHLTPVKEPGHHRMALKK